MDENEIREEYKKKGFLEGVFFTDLKKLIRSDIENILASQELINFAGPSPEDIARINSYLIHLRNDVEKLRGLADAYSSIKGIKKEYLDILAMLDSKLPKEHAHYLQEFFG